MITVTATSEAPEPQKISFPCIMRSRKYPAHITLFCNTSTGVILQSTFPNRISEIIHLSDPANLHTFYEPFDGSITLRNK